MRTASRLFWVILLSGSVFVACSGTPGAATSVEEASNPIEIGSTKRRELHNEATGALHCIQNALGGAKALVAVSSLRISANTKPLVASGPRPLPGRREIVVIFPDRYKRSDLPASPSQNYGSIVGFDRDRLLSNPRLPDNDVSMRSARADMARQIIMRLPRELTGFRLRDRTGVDGATHHAVEVSGAAGPLGTLFAHKDTCVPVALDYRIGTIQWRVELSDYRTYSGIRFPTKLTTVRSGEKFSEEQVTQIDVNSPEATASFGV